MSLWPLFQFLQKSLGKTNECLLALRSQGKAEHTGTSLLSALSEVWAVHCHVP